MPVNYTDLEFAFDFVSSGQTGEHEAYLNIQTGQTYWYSEYGDNEEELPDDIDDKNKYIMIPHKNELDLGKKLVLRFTYEYLPDEEDKIESIFRHKGAYHKFKSILEAKDMIEKWYEYENNAQKKAIYEWCKSNGVKING